MSSAVINRWAPLVVPAAPRVLLAAPLVGLAAPLVGLAAPLVVLAAPLVLLATAICLLGACDRPPKTNGTSKSAVSASSQRAPDALELPEDVRRGVCLAHNWQDGGARGYGTSSSQETLEHLSNLGVTSVSLTPFGWMSSLESAQINGEHTGEVPDGAERAERLGRVVAQAHALGLHVSLKPHIWIKGGKWRGDISPTGDDGQPAWDSWWDSYRSFITYYARLAGRLDIDQLVIGVELVSALKASPSQFARMTQSVRGVFDGQLTYAANWDSELPDGIWQQLDAVGVQFYPPLTDKPEPSTELMREALRPHLARWSALSKRVDRPLYILETGYRASPSAVDKPYDWPERVEDDQVDEDLQARAYQALFAELRAQESLAGVYLWKYFTDPNTGEEGPDGFSPRGRPAEEVIRQAFGGTDD